MGHTEEQVRNFMKRIPGELGRLGYDEIQILCNKYFPVLPGKTFQFTNTPSFFIRQKEGGLNVVYRARIEELSGNRSWEHINDLSFVQEKDLVKIKEFGRLNRPGEAVFYGALDRKAACAEAITKGEPFRSGKAITVTLGIWKFEAPLTIFEMPSSEKYFSRLYKLVGLEPNAKQLEAIQKRNAEFKEQLNDSFGYEQFEFFANEFAKFGIGSHKEYMLSTYFSHRVFNRFRNFNEDYPVDAILYPSVAISYQLMNIALKPEVIMQAKLRLIRAEKVWVRNLEKQGKEAEFITLKRSKAILPDGTIEWPT